MPFSRPVPPMTPERDAATYIVRTLRDAGRTAYFAGGCVRDELLGLSPSDYDVATEADPVLISRTFPKTNAVGAHFGVVLVKLGRTVTEVATFRSDGAYSDKRRPDSVTFSTPEADAERRDFTVNALFLDPLSEVGAGGRVIDFVGGLADLERRVLRAVGDPDRRLAEDHLRALRAARLSAKLGFAIEQATADAIRRHAFELAGVSRERIGDEIRLILEHPSRVAGVHRLSELALDGPALAEPSRVTPTATLAGLEAGDVPVPLALAAVAVDREGSLSAADCEKLVDRYREALCLSNEEREAMAATLGIARRVTTEWRSLPVATRKRLASGGRFGLALRLLGSIDRSLAAEVDRDVRALSGTSGGLAPTPWVDGLALIGAGLKPGPRFKAILDQVYDAQLEGRVGSPEAALELAKSLGVT
jgi:poly(A) polymerase